MHGQCDARPTVTFPAAGHHRPLTGTKLVNCLVNRGTSVWTTCLRSLPGSVPVWSRTCTPEWPQHYKSGTLPLDCRATNAGLLLPVYMTVLFCWYYCKCRAMLIRWTVHFIWRTTWCWICCALRRSTPSTCWSDRSTSSRTTHPYRRSLTVCKSTANRNYTKYRYTYCTHICVRKFVAPKAVKLFHGSL